MQTVKKEKEERETVKKEKKSS